MKLRTFLLSACGALCLISCESSRSKVDYASAPDSGQGDSSAMTPEVTGDSPNAPVLIAPHHSGVASNPNVDIYDFGQGAPSAPSYASPSYDSGVMPVVSDPSVTIFPLDGVQPMAPAPRGYPSPSPSYPSDSGMMQNPAISYSGVAGAKESIYFNFGSSRLGSTDMQRISSAAEEAKFAPVDRVTVAGHASKPTQAGTDSVDAHILNLKESMNRSFEVSKTLMRQGVPAEKIKAVSWGATRSSGVEEQDRRVDIIMGEQ